MSLKKPAALTATALAALTLASAAALAQDKTHEWKYSHWVPATHPLQPILQTWAKSIDEASKGTIKITIFPAQQLGKAPDHYDMVEKGIADVAYVSTGYQAGRMLVTSVAQMPMRAAGSGHTMVKLKPEELAAWRKSAEPVLAKWKEDMKAAGHDGDKVLAEFRAALKKYNALAE